MYYLIKLFPHSGPEKYTKFDCFKTIKDEALKLLDAKGWDNKDDVDLRSVHSCLSFVYNDFRNYRLIKTTSFKKYINWN